MGDSVVIPNELQNRAQKVLEGCGYTTSFPGDTHFPSENNEVTCMLASEGVEPFGRLYIVLARAISKGAGIMYYALAQTEALKEAGAEADIMTLPAHLTQKGPDFKAKDVVACEVDCLRLRLTVTNVHYNGYGDWKYEVQVQDDMPRCFVNHDKMVEWKALRIETGTS